MNKKVTYVFLVIMIIIITLQACRNTQLKYPQGIDTYMVFGNGTFQISGEEYKSLFTEKYNACLIQYVDKTLEAENKAYIIGSDIQGYGTDEGTVEIYYHVYAVIDTEDSTIQLYATPENPSDRQMYIYKEKEMIENGDMVRIVNYSDFSEEDQAVFTEMLDKDS